MKRLETTMLWVAGILGACIAVFLYTYFVLSHAPQENTRRVEYTVKAVCDYSRMVQSGEAEEACGKAQDVSQTEYLCNDNDCWVEDKR